MTDGPAKDLFKDFINKLSPERKPLSEAEKRGSLEVADTLRYMAEKKIEVQAKDTGIKDFGSFIVETPNLKREIDIWLGKERARSFKPKKSANGSSNCYKRF